MSGGGGCPDAVAAMAEISRVAKVAAGLVLHASGRLRSIMMGVARPGPIDRTVFDREETDARH